MKTWKNKLVAILFALAGVLFFVPVVVGAVIREEPLNHTYLVLALSCSVFAMIFFAVGWKSAGGPAA